MEHGGFNSSGRAETAVSSGDSDSKQEWSHSASSGFLRGSDTDSTAPSAASPVAHQNA